MIAPLAWGGGTRVEGNGQLQMLSLDRGGLAASSVVCAPLAVPLMEAGARGWEMVLVSPGAEEQPQGWRKVAWDRIPGYLGHPGSGAYSSSYCITPHARQLLFLSLYFVLPFTVSAK